MGLGLGRAGPWALAAAAAVLAVGAFYRAASGGGGGGGEGGLPAGAGAGEAPSRLHVGWVLARAGRQGWALRARGEAALRSLVRQVRLGPGQALHLHLLCDADSRPLGQDLLRQALRHAPFPHQVWFHDVDGLAAELRAVVEAMQRLFSAGAGAYYGDPLFFLSVALHRLLPPEIPRIIQMDLDVEYRANILELFEEFDRFPEGAVIGIAREMQPVYRHIFWQYRQEHPGTKVGEPPPDGMPGFNSGVLLLNLDAMRQSALYNRLLEPEAVRRLAEKYHFKGHLGDQDFFTLAGMEHPALFHVLDCTWNRQLCSWWRDHGYAEVFDRYFQCDGDVKIYHGNCNTPIPAE